MKIAQLGLRGIAGLPDLSLDLRGGHGRPHDLVLVTGPEASGKTRLLELVAAGLEAVAPYQGIVRSEDWVGPEGRGQLELMLWLDERESAASGSETSVRATVSFGPDGVVVDVPRAVRRILSSYDHDPEHGKREYFPEGRQRAWGARRDGTSALEQSLWRGSRDPQKYGFVPAFLAELPRDARRSRVFEHGLQALSRTVRYTPDASRSTFTQWGITQRGCFSAQGNSDLFYGDLSSSETNAVILAATAALTGLAHSLVLLDRPELYLEPERVVTWVHDLASLGDDNQWIVASQHPALVEALHPSQVIALDRGAA